MQYAPLGHSELNVSRICLGTMTFGEQNTEAEAHDQLDCALSHGVNFIDTAEMYPVPCREETQGRTEQYIGTWLKKSGRRGDVILASKVAGPGMMEYLRDGPQLTADHIEAALEASLERLQTDCIDLYQVHWPARNTNFFGKLGYESDPAEAATPIEETYACLAKAVEQGKVRYVGVSNETPWGVMQYQSPGPHPWLARRGQRTESVQPAEPHLRNRSGRNLPSRKHRTARLLPAGIRCAFRQVPGWQGVRRCAPDPLYLL